MTVDSVCCFCYLLNLQHCEMYDDGSYCNRTATKYFRIVYGIYFVVLIFINVIRSRRELDESLVIAFIILKYPSSDMRSRYLFVLDNIRSLSKFKSPINILQSALVILACFSKTVSCSSFQNVSAPLLMEICKLYKLEN